MKSLQLSEDYQPVLARFLAGTAVDDYRKAAPAGAPHGWAGLVEHLGVTGLLVEEERGGQGAGAAELAAAALEAGRSGWSGPLVTVAGVTVVLTRLLDQGDEHGLRAAVASGTVVVPAILEGHDALDVHTCATTVDAAGAVSGTKAFVDGGMHAERLLVTARSAEGLELRLVHADATGVLVRQVESVDPARGVAEVVLDGAPSTRVASGDAVAEALTRAWRWGAVLTAAELVGTATRVLDLSCEYARTREQFGRTIGSFQAVKHVCADMYAELETASSAVRAAVRDLDEHDGAAVFSAAAAKARAGDAAMQVARQGVQVHGGIGFTWEHEMSHHFRRATFARAAYGTPAAHRAVLAAEVGL